MGKKIFVTGIGTDVGKTLASVVLAEAWHADYWKPIQAGNLDQLETDFVRSLLSNPTSVIHASQVLLKTPCSPHHAAKLDGLSIQAGTLGMPETNNHLLIEGAGGLMVPLSTDFLILDLIQYWSLPVIVVSRNYLGSINHTLLTLEVLKYTSVKVLGLVFTDTDKWNSMEHIATASQIPVIGYIPHLDKITPQRVSEVAAGFKKISDL